MGSLPQAPPDPVPVVPVARPTPPAIHRVRRRRRPSGEPPPLPRHLNASGKWWLALSGLVVTAWLVVIATGNVAAVDVADTRMLQAIAEVRTPWLTRLAEVGGFLATGRALHVLWLADLLALVVLRRWRHLFVWTGAGLVVIELSAGMASALQRPGPSRSRCSVPGPASPCPRSR